jgi:hypothetical protein
MSALDSDDAREQALAQHNDDPFLVLLTLSHATLAEPIYIVCNRQKLVSRGNTYLAYPFQIELPTDGDEAPQARITIANVSREIGSALEKLITPPLALIEIVLASAPDDVERSWDQFELSGVTWDAMRMTATLQHRQVWAELYPRYRVTPKDFPGLFP